MTEQNYERELGGINAKLEIIVKQQGEIFDRLNTITTEGCSRGKRNTTDIDELKRRPERTISMLSALAAVVAAVLAWVKSGAWK